MAKEVGGDNRKTFRSQQRPAPSPSRTAVVDGGGERACVVEAETVIEKEALSEERYALNPILLLTSFVSKLHISAVLSIFRQFVRIGPPTSWQTTVRIAIMRNNDASRTEKPTGR